MIESATRPYWPLSLALNLVSPVGGSALIAASILARAQAARSLPMLGLSIVDDATRIRSASGKAIRHRSMRCLLPKWL
ncbi:MAG: hypothetical protein R2706_18400 [Acidimicrobiales bacterium]